MLAAYLLYGPVRARVRMGVALSISRWAGYSCSRPHSSAGLTQMASSGSVTVSGHPYPPLPPLSSIRGMRVRTLAAYSCARHTVPSTRISYTTSYS